MIELREYQLEANRELWRRFRAHQAVLLQAPTGSGKTAMAAHFIAMRREHKRERTLMLAHRREIVNQSAAKLEDVGLDVGIVMAGHSPKDWADVQVGSIDTVWGRKATGFPDAEFVVVDECHRAMGAMYSTLIAEYKRRGAKILGLTATPIRTDGQGLLGMFEWMVRTPDIPELVRMGFLVPFHYAVGIAPDLSHIKNAGDYDQKKREDAFNQGYLIGDIVRNWIKYAAGMKTMVFAAGVKHSLHIVEEFEKVGIRAVHVDGTTPSDVRDAIYDELTDGDLKVVSNAQVYVEGTDIPCLECIVDAAATKSVTKYLQAAGRAMRPYPGKTTARYHDHSGNVFRHGYVETPRDWTLSEGKEALEHLEAERKKIEKMQIVCKRCGLPHHKPVCPFCGFEFVPEGRMKGFLPADLVEMTQAQFEQEWEKKNPRKSKTREYTMHEKQVWYSGLLWIANARGHSLGWAAHAYREKFGVWPNKLKKEPTKSLLEVDAWVKRRAMLRRKANEKVWKSGRDGNEKS